MKKRTIMGLTLAGLLAVTMVGCTHTPTGGDPNDPDNTITQPSGPSEPSEPSDPNQGSGTTDPTEQYSATLRAVLNDPYYDEVIEEFYETGVGSRRSNKVFAIPYGYIESIGIDTTPIKNDEVKAYATTYIKDDEPNYLYVYARVETDSTTPYYTCYNLKYSITDQEKEELEMLHEDGYIQAPFFIQELSYQKTPVDAKVASLTKARYESYLYEFKRDPIIQEALGEDIDFTLLGFSVEDKTFDVQMMTNPDPMIDKGEIRSVQLIPNIGSPMYTVGNNVLDYPLAWTCTSEELEKFQNNVTNVTYYFSYNRVTFGNYESELESEQ